MITSTKTKSITKQFAANVPFYADVCDGRKNRRCHRYTINENLYFEYWTPDEWEYTVTATPDDHKYMPYMMLVIAMTEYMNNIRVTYSKLPSSIPSKVDRAKINKRKISL